MIKRLISLALSLGIILQIPGFPAYQALAAASKGSPTPSRTPAPTPLKFTDLSASAGNQGPFTLGQPAGSFIPPAPPILVNGRPLKAGETVVFPETVRPIGGLEVKTAILPAAHPAVKAATNSEKPAEQTQALDTIYEGVGPGGKDRAVFTAAEGPIFHMNYQPAERLARAPPKVQPGKTPVHVLIGTAKGYGRGWYDTQTGEIVSNISQNEIPGLQRVVVDAAANKVEGVEHFIEADLLDLSEKNKAAVAAKVTDYLNKNNLQAMGANAFAQGYVRMASVLQEALQRDNNPNMPVNPAAAVYAIADKLATRMIVGESVASLKWPAASVGTVDDANIEDKAAEAFREMVKQVPSGKVMLKLRTGAGKAGLRAGGIATEEELRQAVREVVNEVKTYWTGHALHDLYIQAESSGPTEILMEGLIDRLAEVDSEFTATVLPDGSIDIVGTIIGNPAPGEKEKGYVFGMNGLLSAALQRMLLLAAVESAVAVWKKHGGVPFGNFHVEIILRGDPADPKSALVEINGPRPIGGNGVRLAKEWHTPFDLLENGARGSMGLPQKMPATQPEGSLILLGIEPQVSGTVTKTQAPADLPTVKMAQFGTNDPVTKKAGQPLFLQLSEVGEKVEGAGTPHPGILGGMVARGKDAKRAVMNILGALDKVSYEVTDKDGKVHAQKGTTEHSKADYRPLPQTEPVDELGLGTTGRRELDQYAKAQLRWLPIFRIYMPLFAAAMNAVGGIAAIGIGRMGYTMALFISSPFASVLSARLPVRTVLKYTWLARIAVWAVLLPIAVVLFPPSLPALFTIAGISFTPLITALFALNFLDGLVVSFSHPVDLDAGGMDEVAKQNDFDWDMSPKVRKHYFALYSAWNAKASMIFPLAIALAVTGASALALPVTWAFILGMAASFAVLGGRAVLSINKLSKDAVMEKPEGNYLKDFTGGVSMVVKDKKILGLVSLEALERALGDVLYMVAFPMLGLFALRPVLGLDESGAALASTILLSIMSYAALRATRRARSNWKEPAAGAPEHPAYKPLYPMMLLAGLTTLLIPAAFYLMTAGFVWAGLAAAAASGIAFMYAFKPAQFGAMNMMQTAAAAHPGSTRIFGLSSAIQMLVAGVAVWLLSALFPDPKVSTDAGLPFLIVSGFFIAVGLAYRMIWPRLASREPAKKA